jgi:endonuclease YncB( thermonuclease family)
MKKIIINLLIVAMLMGTVLGSLSACNDASNSNVTTEQTTTSDPTDTTAPDAPEDAGSREDDTTASEVPTTAPTDTTLPEETTTAPAVEDEPKPSIDYAGELKLDMDSETLKQEVTVKTFIDGDTTHFYVPTSLMDNGVIKARYLAINTPESTGKIEEWGKAASSFTKESFPRRPRSSSSRMMQS